MNPLDPSLAKPIIDQWGVYGVILILLVGALIWLTKALLKSMSDRLADTKETIQATLKASNDSTQVARDVKTALDVMSKSFDQALSIVKGLKS